MTATTHREACLSILSKIFVWDTSEFGTDSNILHPLPFHTNLDGSKTIKRRKVLELLEVIQFRSPDTAIKYSQVVSNLKYDLQVEEILKNPSTSDKGGVYYYSERGDHLIDLPTFRDKLWQKCIAVNPQLSSFGSESEFSDLRETIPQLLRWGWRYNKNLEEQAAQLHMLTGWSQIVEVSVSQRMSSLENRSEILFEVLDASLSASASPDCSLKMATLLSQVALTCMAKLRDERFTCPAGVNSDSVTSLDIILVKQLPNGACQSILLKLILTILRHESSEVLRRRQYALLLSYFQYCRHMLDPDVPASVLQFLMHEQQVGEEDLDLQKVSCFYFASMVGMACLKRLNFDSGTLYHYAYICVGKGVAWLIGWALILEYIVGGSAVARGISPNLALFFWGPDSLPSFLARIQIPGLDVVVDPCAAILVLVVTGLLCVGIKESSLVQAIRTTINVCVMVFVVIAGGCLGFQTGWVGYEVPNR